MFFALDSINDALQEVSGSRCRCFSIGQGDVSDNVSFGRCRAAGSAVEASAGAPVTAQQSFDVLRLRVCSHSILERNDNQRFVSRKVLNTAVTNQRLRQRRISVLSSNQWIRIQSNFGLRSGLFDQMVRWSKKAIHFLEIIRPSSEAETSAALEVVEPSTILREGEYADRRAGHAAIVFFVAVGPPYPAAWDVS